MIFDKKKNQYLKHVGIYLYKSNFLKIFTKLKRSFSEKKYNLEQLRIIDNNFKIISFQASHDTVGVDTYEDLKKIKKTLI